MSELTHERSARLWRLSLSDGFPASAIPADLQNVTTEDAPALGALFFAAFSGTIDDSGQTEDQYRSKARAIFDGRYGAWIRQASWMIQQTDGLRSACLVSDYKPYGCPVIAVIATAPTHKRSGDGGTLLRAALASLATLGHRECCAMVTVGNTASERLFQKRGFLPSACDTD